jgi:hypothetical protein
MPFILAEEDWPAWLGEIPATDAGLKALPPFPSDRMELELWPVDRAISNRRDNGPLLIDRSPSTDPCEAQGRDHAAADRPGVSASDRASRSR